MFKNYFKNKTIIVTGHTGFKGSWLTLWLKLLGAKIIGISLNLPSRPSHFEKIKLSNKIIDIRLDIRNLTKLEKIFKKYQPDYIFHLAAQALVKKSYAEPADTFTTNTIGTMNVLESLKKINKKFAAIIITSDKSYKNLEIKRGYKEEDELGGADPYSSSKASAELIIQSYFKSYLADKKNIRIAAARAGNVIGGGDWSLDRLIPDAIRAWQVGEPIEIRQPNSTRPWQHVLEPLTGYLILVEELWKNASLEGAYNFGPFTQDAASVRDLIEMARKAHGNALVCYDEEHQGPHEAGLLALDISKAQQTLGFQPGLTLANSIQRTIGWYQSQFSGLDPRELCDNEIAVYEASR